MTAYLCFFVVALTFKACDFFFLMDVLNFLVQNSHTNEYSIAENLHIS